MQRTTFNMLGPRPPVNTIDSQIVRERLGKLSYLDPSVIIKTDSSVAISVDKNVYTISSNLEFKTIKDLIVGNTIPLPTDNFGIQEILVNLDDDNSSPAFAPIDGFDVNNKTVIFDTLDYHGKLCIIRYLTIK